MLLIKNAKVKTMAGRDIENGRILIENGKIVKIGTDIESPGAQEIDAGGRLVTPGLVDAHCHIGLHEEGIGFEGMDHNEITDPITPNLRAIDAINPTCEAFDYALQGGVTTAVTGPGSANVVGGTFVAIKLRGKRVDDMIIKDPVAMKVAFGENPKKNYNSQNKSPKTRMATAALLRELLEKSIRYKNELEKSEKDPDVKAPAYDAKLHAMLPVLRGEIPLKAHAHRTDDIFTSIRIANEYGVGITLDHCTEGHLIAEELAKENKPVFIGPSFGSKTKYELKNKTFETPGKLAQHGVKFAIITDAPVIPLQYLSLCAGLAVKAGLDPDEAWKAVTINPAQLTGIGDRVGSIEEGKDADIVIWNGNPIFDIGAAACCTILNGEIVYQSE